VSPRDERLRSSEDERGTVLVLALMFIFAVGLTIGAIVTLVSANLLATQGLQRNRAVEYGAAAAVEGAIQALRYAAPTSPPTCSPFPSSTSSIPVNNQSYVVDCTMGVPNGFYGRLVQFDACLSSNASSCQQNAILEVNAVYDDVAPGCTNGALSGCYGSSWGTKVTITSWDVKHADG